MTWIAYFDESGTDTASPIIYMGCALARAERWLAFESEWNEILNAYSLTHVHGYDLQQSRKQFAGWSLKKSLELGWKLQGLFEKHLYACGTAILRKDDYETEYAAHLGSAPTKRSALGLTFEVLFLFAIDHVVDKLGEDEAVDFVYELGAMEIGDVKEAYASLKSDASLEPWRGHIGSLSVVGKKGYPGIQAADMLVYHSNRAERKEHGSSYSEISQSSLVAGKSSAPKPDSFSSFRIPITANNLRDLRSVHSSGNSASMPRETDA